MLKISDANKIGIFAAISYTIGDIIGSGIFVSPTSILKHTGSIGMSLVAWAVCAIISGIGAVCYIELGTSIRKSGNDFAYLSHVGWRPFSVAFLWVSTILTYPSILAVQTRTFGNYVVEGINNLLELDDADKGSVERLTGFLMLWILIFLNYFSLKSFAGRFQVVATISKMLVCSLVIVTGFIFLIFKSGHEKFHNAFQNTTNVPGDLVLGVYSGLFAYNGWDILNFGTEEVERPRRTLPIAAFVGISVSALVFLSMNISYFAVLSVEQFKTSDAVAVTLGNFFYVVPFLIAVLLMGNLNSTIFGSSRYLFAGARRRGMPTFLTGMHAESQSPRLAITFELFVCIGVSFIGSLDSLITYMTFAIWTQRTIVQIAIIYMKIKKWPLHPDALHVPLIVNFVFLFICIALLAIPVWQNYHVAIYGTSLIIVGLSVYCIFIFPNNLPAFFYAIDEKVTIFAQVVFNVIPSEFEEQEKANKNMTMKNFDELYKPD